MMTALASTITVSLKFAERGEKEEEHVLYFKDTLGSSTSIIHMVYDLII